MEKPTVVSGRVWVLMDAGGRRIDDIDTDMIFHNAHLAITDVAEMGRYALGNLQGWEDFPDRARLGDILIVGRNFGAGSSRQQAVDCFRSLGIQLIVGESFGAIYRRNTINSGLPLLVCPDVCSTDWVTSGDQVEANFETGELTNRTRNITIGRAAPFSAVQMDIYQAGGLFGLAKKLVG